MKLTRSGRLAAVAVAGLAGVVGIAGCGSNSNNAAGSTTPSAGGSAAQCASGQLNGAGSTFQANMEEQWIMSFRTRCSGAQINYQATGSGAGITQFGTGTIDFAGSDVAMTAAEQATANRRCAGPAIHIPIVTGGVAIEYNLPNITHLQLSGPTLAGIFEGTIKTWDAKAIAADNPGEKLPKLPIAAYHRSDASGTTSVLSSFLAAEGGSGWTLGTGKKLNWPAGQAAKGSDGVTAAVKQTTGGITYSEISYAVEDHLPTALVKGAGSSYEQLTTANVSSALSSFQITGSGNNLAGKVDFATTSGYPISTVSYVIVCAHDSNAAKGRLIKAYLRYALGAGQSEAAALGYAPLPAAIEARALAVVASLS